MGKYIYEGHLGGLYTSEEPVPYNRLYCEQCGDSDNELGYAENRAEAKEIMESYDMFTDECIEAFLDEEFPERRESE